METWEQGDFIDDVKLDNSFIPGPNKSYTGIYEVKGGENDQDPTNNFVSFRFKTDKSIVSKNGDKYSINSGFAPQGTLTYEIGTCFYIPQGGKVAATGMQFSLADPHNMHESNSFVLGINLYRWSKGGMKGDVNGDFQANVNEYERIVDTFFTVDQKYSLFDLIEVPFDEGIVFEEDTYYFVTVNYFSPVYDLPFFIAASEEINYVARYENSLAEGRPTYVSMLRRGLDSDFEVNAWGLLRVPYIQLKVDGFTDTEELVVEELPVNLYPNPANNKIFVDLTNAYPGSGLAYEIYDICGRLAMPRQTVVGYVSHLPIDISHLDNGIYNLQVISEKQVTVRKFVVANKN